MTAFARYLLVILSLSLFAGQADAAACGGRDQWKRLPQADRAALQAQMARTPFGQGRFFKVQKGDAVSWIFGTQHTPASGRHALPGMVSRMLRKSRIAYVELSDKNARIYGDNINTDSPYVVNKRGTGFERQFTAQQWKALALRAQARNLSPKILPYIQPWFLYYSLSGPACDTGRWGTKMDDRIERIARRARIPAVGLDDPVKVLRLLNGDSSRDYALMLKAALADGPQNAVNDLKTADEMYLRGDIQMIQIYNTYQMTRRVGAAAAKAYRSHTQDILLGARNKLWMKTLGPEFGKGGVFVAVGALHLGGRHGLLTTLARQGYSIARVDLKR